MTRYADSLLSDGERVVMRSRQHWLSTLIDGRYPWLLFLASLVVLFLSQNVTGAARDILGYAVLAGIVVSLAWLGRIYWNWASQDYLVTNRRVLKIEGIFNKRSADSSLEKINDAVLEQNVIARMLNYGDLDILTASDVAIDRYRMLDRAPEFKRQMLNQKHELEGEWSRPVPSPPLRASVAAAPAAAASSAVTARGDASAPTAAPPAPARPPMTPDEVTRSLASLADLRDRGAITPDEYEAKKTELLARL